MDYLFFIVYLILLCLLIRKIPFLRNAGLNSNTLLFLFLIKIAAGIIIGWLSLHYYSAGNDYWDVNREGLAEYHLMQANPHEYFTNLFRSGYPSGYSGIFDSFHSFWNDLKNNLIIKLVSVFDIFSRGNYYTNSLFFNFLVFFGHVALYRLFIKIFPVHSLQVIIGCFLLPSLLYFSSGIHKDGMVFLMLAFLFYTLFRVRDEYRFTFKRVSLIVITMTGLFLLRNFVFLALLPALMAYFLVIVTKWRPALVFTMTYILAGLVFFNLHIVFPQLDPVQTIVQKQTDYLQLPPSSTAFQLDTLQPSFSGFLHNAPQSLGHILVRPYLTELPSPILLPMNIELFLYQLLILLFLFFPVKRTDNRSGPLLLFLIFFTLTVFLFIGYIVPNLGSLIRYRSLYLPFIITPLLCLIDFGKCYRLIKITK